MAFLVNEVIIRGLQAFCSKFISPNYFCYYLTNQNPQVVIVLIVILQPTGFIFQISQGIN